MFRKRKHYVRGGRLTWALTIGPAAAALVAGCISVGPRTYEYAIDLRNQTDQTLSVELLKIESHQIRKVAVDLAPGATYTEKFSTDGYGADYVEARIAPAGSPPGHPRELVELRRGRSAINLERREGRIVASRVVPPSDE